MEITPFLRDLVVLMAAALPIVYLCQRLGLPAVVGFLLTGVVIGPTGTGLIASVEAIHVLAEIGLVLLLFTIGIEFSFAQLLRLGAPVLAGGALQILGTIAVVAIGLFRFGVTLPTALTAGFLTALSSTAIVLKLLSDRAELSAPQGQIALGILLLQDLCVVPMMLVLPLLSRPEEISPLAVLSAVATALLVVFAIALAGRRLLPLLLDLVIALRIREVLTGTVVLICFGTAWLTAQFGLSLAIGAFIAGLVISESEYSHQVAAEILPFRDLFNSIFFISMGMLLDIPFLFRELALVGGGVAATLVLKGAIGAAVVLLFRVPLRIALLVAVLLAQIGEFSFVLAREAERLHLLSAPQLQTLIAVSVITMLISPFLLATAVRWAAHLPAGAPADAEVAPPRMRGHVVIVGYGLNGRNLARVLRDTGLPYRILELNPAVVREARAREPITFGDATRPDVLRHVGTDAAAVIVIAISDPAATRRVVSLARALNPDAGIIARTRYMQEIEQLYGLGADEVIPEEFETSVEIFARVLRRMHVPRNVIAMQVDLIRNEGYAMLRGLKLPHQHFADLQAILAATTTETYLLRQGSVAVGQMIRTLHLRRRSGATIIAVVRDGRPFANPSPDLELAAGDVLVLLGSHAELARAMRLLDPGAERPS